MGSEWAWKDAQATGEYKEVIVTPKPRSDKDDNGSEPDYVQRTSHEVRVGLKSAGTKPELEVLIQRARALGLIPEEQTGKEKIYRIKQQHNDARRDQTPVPVREEALGPMQATATAPQPSGSSKVVLQFQ